jgi:excisionase family DNA binding protein
MSHQIEQQLAKIESFITNLTLISKESMTLKEAADYMGISKSFLYKLTMENEISFSRPHGKIIFFKRTDLNQFMLSNKVSSKNELLSQLPKQRNKSET